MNIVVKSVSVTYPVGWYYVNLFINFMWLTSYFQKLLVCINAANQTP